MDYIFLLLIAKENPKQPQKAAELIRKIFPLTVLLLASCSPAELASPSDSDTNVVTNIYALKSERYNIS
ncbi:MAG: hypothetical protein PF484_10190 [Bacteroidales bacterium]|jgi:hypothetical protein|nr:hypothetical protein [Bacteroidales bacterium]